MRIFALTVLLLASFLIGCDPVAHERIVLTLPNTNELASVTSAVNAVDAILTDLGFAPTHNTNSELVAIYGGVGRLGCLVRHRSGKLEILFTEMGRFSSRPEAIKARDAVRKKLSMSFGEDKLNQ